jgi:hypothetical protein
MHIASLTHHFDLDTSYSLSGDTLAVEIFFYNNTLRTDHINQLNVVFSLIDPILRYVYSVVPSSIVSHPPMKPSYQSDSDAKKPKSGPLVVWRTNNCGYTEPDSWIF